MMRPANNREQNARRGNRGRRESEEKGVNLKKKKKTGEREIFFVKLQLRKDDPEGARCLRGRAKERTMKL